MGLRRRAAESLGLLAKRSSGDGEQRRRIKEELVRWLHSEPLNLLVMDEAGWAKHDARLPLLQGAARGLQLAASADLPLAGSGPGRVVPMLTLMATEEEGGLRNRMEVVEVPVWVLPLPGSEQLELVAVPAGDYTIGSPAGEAGRDVYPQFLQKCERVDVEARRPVRLGSFAMVRDPISQGQWRAVVEGVAAKERELEAGPGKANPESLWDVYAQPGALAVDSVCWFDCGEWLARLNRWLAQEWATLGGKAAVPQLELPSESRWEVACRAGSSTPFHVGDTLDPSWANYDDNYTYGRGRKGKYRHRPTATGALAVVNLWGLAEMHGQLQEWCGDRWHPNPVGEGWPKEGGAWEEPDADLEGFQDQVYRLLRGGSCINDPPYCRAAYRHSSHPVLVFRPDIGVRPCCLLPPGLTS